jgi:steroid 5-alpha reductase family enzyme
MPEWISLTNGLLFVLVILLWDLNLATRSIGRRRIKDAEDSKWNQVCLNNILEQHTGCLGSHGMIDYRDKL